MSGYDAKKIEEYQLILLKDPRSKVFAALAEAYRKMGLLEEALETSQKGLSHHPEYVSGLVAQAKILFEMQLYDQSIPLLNKALSLRQENILAYRLLAHCHLKQKNHLKALQCYKKLLVFSPNDEKAISFINKWEFLETLAFTEESDFDIEKIEEWVSKLPSPDEVATLVDAYVNKNEVDFAKEILDIGRLSWPQSGLLKQREDFIFRLTTTTSPLKKAKINFYKRLLQRIEERKMIDQINHP